MGEYAHVKTVDACADDVEKEECAGKPFRAGEEVLRGLVEDDAMF